MKKVKKTPTTAPKLVSQVVIVFQKIEICKRWRYTHRMWPRQGTSNQAYSGSIPVRPHCLPLFGYRYFITNGMAHLSLVMAGHLPRQAEKFAKEPPRTCADGGQLVPVLSADKISSFWSTHDFEAKHNC